MSSNDLPSGLTWEKILRWIPFNKSLQCPKPCLQQHPNYKYKGRGLTLFLTIPYNTQWNYAKYLCKIIPTSKWHSQAYRSKSLPWKQGRVIIACFVQFRLGRISSTGFLEFSFGTEPKVSLLKFGDCKHSLPSLGADVLSGKSSQDEKEVIGYPFMEAKMSDVNTAQVETTPRVARWSWPEGPPNWTHSKVFCPPATAAAAGPGQCAKVERCYCSRRRERICGEKWTSWRLQNWDLGLSTWENMPVWSFLFCVTLDKSFPRCHSWESRLLSPDTATLWGQAEPALAYSVLYWIIPCCKASTLTHNTAFWA